MSKSTTLGYITFLIGICWHMSLAAAPIEIKDDPYRPDIEFKSSLVQFGPASDQKMWLLIGRMERANKNRTYYVQWYAIYSSPNWRLYSSASTSKGEVLKFDVVDRHIDRCYARLGECVYGEVYNIFIPDKIMGRATKEGLSFKLFARDQSESVVNISAELATSLLQQMIHPGTMPTTTTIPPAATATGKVKAAPINLR